MISGHRVPVALAVLPVAAILLSGCAGDRAPVTASPARQPPQVDVAASPACPDLPRADPRPDGLPDEPLACLGAGPDVRLSDLRGTPMVLNVWAAWCTKCAAEMPVLRAMQERAGNRLRFFGVHYKAERDHGLQAAADFGVSFPSVHDEDGDLIAGSLQAFAPPQTFFVTADGRIAGRKIGEITSAEELAKLVEEHLGVRV